MKLAALTLFSASYRSTEAAEIRPGPKAGAFSLALKISGKNGKIRNRAGSDP